MSKSNDGGAAMDKYDEMSHELIATYPAFLRTVEPYMVSAIGRSIAAALRQSAALAYEDALETEWNATSGILWRERTRAKAAALRSKP